MAKINSMTAKDNEVDLLDIYHALDGIVPSGEAWTFGEFKKLPVIPGLHVHGIGNLPLPMTSFTAKELQRISCHSITNDVIPNSIQIPGDQVTFKNPAWKSALADLTWKIGRALGVNQTLVYPKLHKLLVHQEGSVLAPETEELPKRAFGKLMIQLPSVYSGATYALSNNRGERVWTHSMDMPEAPYKCNYISHYADCESKIPPIQSGHLLVLEYTLCYRGREIAKPNLDSLKNGHLVSLMQRLPKSKTLFVLPLNNPDPPHRREVRCLKGDNKKFTNAFSNVIGDWELAFAMLKKGDGGDPYLSCWYPQGGKYACTTKSWMSETFNYSSVEDGGVVLSSPESLQQYWQECASGKQGPSKEKEYFMYVLIAFKPKDSFERLLCRPTFRSAIARIEKNFDRLGMVIDFLRQDKDVVLKHDTFSELRKVVRDMYGETGAYWELLQFLFQRLTVLAVPPGYLRDFIAGAIQQHGHSDKINGLYSYLQRLSNYDKDESPEYSNDKAKFFESLYEETGWFHVAKVQEFERKYLDATATGRPAFSWSMPDAKTTSPALNSFLHSVEEGPREIVIGGGIDNARELREMQQDGNTNFLADGYSAKMSITGKIGAQASVIVHKTKQLHQAQIKLYEHNMKILREVQTKLHKHRQAQQPDEEASPKRVRIQEVVA